jgi:hypothetical protein
MALPSSEAVANDSDRAAVGPRASSDFDGDGFDDLAVGVPEEDIGTIRDAGAVNVLYGSPGGLTATGDQFFHQNTPGVQDTAERDDLFGDSLVTGDFDGDGFDDLAVGVPFEDIVNIGDEAGAVNVLYGSPQGLTATGDQFLHQDSPGIRDRAELTDGFGRSLAAADFGRSPQSDLAVGVPSEDIGTIVSAGAVNVLYGSPQGLTASILRSALLNKI